MLHAILLCLLAGHFSGLGAAQEQLTCVACSEGSYLTQEGCLPCPENSFTLPGLNGSSINACECVAGFSNASAQACSACLLDTFKPALGNTSCLQCPENTQTLETGATAETDCLCDPGFQRDADSGLCAKCVAGTFKPDVVQTTPEGPVQYTLTYLGGQYALNGVQSPALTLYRGLEVVIAWPSGHPLHITAENLWRGADISGLVVDAVAQTTTITLDAAHEDALYYYCYAHESMGVHAITVASPIVAEAECKVCTVGGYCPIGSVSPTACPADSTSAANATSIRDCKCAAGFFADFGVDGEGAETLVCVPCPAGTFNPADSAETINAEQCVACPTNTYFAGTGAASAAECVPCPAQASAPAGSGDATACLCALGYAGEPGEECVACLPGFFRSNASEYICKACPANSYHDVNLYASTNVESCLPCPADTSSAPGSGSASACVCDAGHYAADAASRDAWSDPWQCEPCAGGSFSTTTNATVCALCEAGKYSAATGASTAETCLLCAAGEFTLNAGSVACELCAPGTWQDAAAGDHTRAIACLACPQFSGHGLNGSVSVDDCVCAGGFYKDVSAAGYEPGDVFQCEVCTAGSACPGNNSRIGCPVSFYAEAGASTCVPCPPNSEGVLNVGLLSESQCQCVPGYEGTFGQHCVACSAGEFQGADYTYDSADTGLRAEVADALQVSGLDGLTAFVVTCEACAEGTFSNAPAQSVCVACAANASSPIGSDANTDCACEAGFYGPDGGPCVQCPAGSFCVGGLSEAQTCRLHSTSAAGATSEAECACVAGYFSTTDDGACQKCPAGSYCPGGLVVEECAVNSTSLAGAAAASACTCFAGTWRGCTPVEGGGAVDSNNEPCEIDFLLPCVECGEDVVCLNNTVLHCPEHSTAPAGSSHSEDCVCEGGYFNQFLLFV